MPNFSQQADQIDHETVSSPVPHDSFERRVFRATAIVLATLAAAYMLWMLVDLLLLLFACSLVSLILLTITNAIRRRTRLPFAAALALSVLALLALIVGAFTFFGTTLQGEFAELGQRLPKAWADVEARLRGSTTGADRARRTRLAASFRKR